MKFATKLTMLFSALFLILCIFITHIVTSSSNEILERTIENQMEARAVGRMDKIDKIIYERLMDLKMLASEPLLKLKNPSPGLIAERLGELSKSNGSYASISFFDMSRKRIADTAGQDVGRIHTLNEFWLGIKSGQDSVIDMYFSESLNMPVFHIATVVKDNTGAPTGVLVGRMSAEWLNEILKFPATIQSFDKVLNEKKLMRMDAVNKNGLIIYSNYDQNSILKNTSTYWKYIKDDVGRGVMNKGYRLRLPGMEEEIVTFGQERGYKDYKGNGWTIILHVPSEVVFASSAELRDRLILHMTAIGGFSLLVILLFARTVSSPLIKLSAAAEEIGRGNLDVKVEVSSNDEVGALAGNLNAMAKNLSASRHAQEKAEEEIRQSEARYRELFENARDYVYTTDLGGIFTSANGALCERCGYRAEELIGSPIGKIVSPASLEKARKMTEAKLKGERANTQYELDIVAMNGEIIPIELNSRLIIVKGKPAGVQGIGRDIGERRAAEKKLEAAKDAAEAATLLKDKFVTLVSHDLKGPLSAMLGFLKLLHKDMEASKAGEKLLLESSINSGENMVSLINDILNVSRIRSGKIAPKLVFTDACFLSVKVISVLAAQAEQKGITLVNRLPRKTRIHADPELLSQVLQNLVSNAIKFSNSGGTVTIFMPEGEPSTIAVSDTGVGISPERIAKLFKYEETKSTTGTAGEAGTGFGLPLSNELVTAHGGSITVGSTPGKGSTFRIRLPFVRPRILIVDDDRLFRELVKEHLHGLDIECIETGDGKEALAIMERSAPHLLLTDLNMPDMDGFALLERVKEDPATKNLPVIVLTVDSGLESRERALRMGADDFIRKGMDKNEFILRITRVLGIPRSLN